MRLCKHGYLLHVHKSPSKTDSSGGYAIDIFRPAKACCRDRNVSRTVTKRSKDHLACNLNTGEIELLNGFETYA